MFDSTDVTPKYLQTTFDRSQSSLIWWRDRTLSFPGTVSHNVGGHSQEGRGVSGDFKIQRHHILKEYVVGDSLSLETLWTRSFISSFSWYQIKPQKLCNPQNEGEQES